MKYLSVKKSKDILGILKKEQLLNATIKQLLIKFECLKYWAQFDNKEKKKFFFYIRVQRINRELKCLGKKH